VVSCALVLRHDVDATGGVRRQRGMGAHHRSRPRAAVYLQFPFGLVPRFRRG
jgi:hypothetical protein